MKKILLLLCSTIILASCNENLGTDREYVVKNKITEEERTEEILMPIRIGKILNFRYIPITVPKKYFIEVEYVECKKIEVSQEEYEKIKIGEKKFFYTNKKEKELETYINNLKINY